MGLITVLIFHRPARAGDSELVRVLADVRERLLAGHSDLFRRAGVSAIQVVDEWHEGKSFGEVLADLAPARGGVVVMSSGAVPLLNEADARRLVTAAGATQRFAATNNRYSSDVCAVAGAATLRDLPPLPSDNAVPRWLEEHAGYTVLELPGRDRLGLDLDTPFDVALTAHARRAPTWLKRAARDHGLEVPRIAEVRALADDPLRELLVFGRSGSRTLAWLERNVRCRVRFLAEERGMRASSPLAIVGVARTGAAPPKTKQPRATLGLLLDERGPTDLADIVRELSDGAIVDTRVLLAHRLSADEANWPAQSDRFASDLLRPAEIEDVWLRELTESARNSSRPILLGGHSLVGPGIRLLLGPGPRPNLD